MNGFDLEKELADWRKRLNKYPGFEPGTAEELVSHVSDAIDDLVQSGMSEKDAFDLVTSEKIGDLEQLSREYHKAKSTMSYPTPGMNKSLAGNFLKVALRNIIKSRPHSFINLTGLIIGLASVIIISAYVFSELSFDRFHSDYDKIYRVINKVNRSGTQLNYPQGPPGLAPALTVNFPELEYATRMRIADRPLIKYEEATFYEDYAYYADSSFFRIFDFELIEGNRLTALSQPNQVVISESCAKKYFGSEEAINKILLLEGTRPLKVTGITKDIPHNSHLYFEMLISFQTFIVPDGYLETLDSWRWLGFFTYIKTYNNVNIPSLESKIANQFQKGDERWAKMDLTIFLQPLTDIYLGSTDLDNPHNLFRGSSYITIYSLIAVGLLIILIASFNYINLSIAMSMSRFKEIAMRKVLGSSKNKLLIQFVFESVLYALMALIAAGFIVWCVLRFLPESLSSQLYLENNTFLLYGTCLIIFTCLIGVVSGLFPALRMATISSLELLRGTFKLKGGILRNFLIGFQFALSASLIAISLIIGKQIEFFTNKNLGFARNGIISINISSDQLQGKERLIENLVRNNAGVQSTAFSSHMMGEGMSGNPLYLPEQQPEDAIQMAYFQTDYNFAATMNLQLTEGRYFSQDFSNDSTESIVLNETAIKTLGLTDPIGKKVIFTGGTEREIIGVVKDFHFNSLHQKIGALAIIMPFTTSQYLVAKLESPDVFNSLKSIESSWNETFPDVPFEFQFLDDYLQSLYQKEQFFSSVIQFFSILATAIACLGLYSLAAISLAGKVKQISIRRVLGAPIKDIIILSSKNFVLLILVSCIISWPLVLYIMNNWLNNFAYHVNLNSWFFGLTFIIILMITLITLSYHLFKAVTVNPAETLRDN